MKVTGIEWDRGNVGHFAHHGRCKWNEVEDVLMSRCHRSRARDQTVEAGSEARKVFEGQTCGDRYLLVIATPKEDGIMRPITCWPLTGKPREKYLAWRRSLPR